MRADDRPEGASRLTLRISTDGGRTYSDRETVTVDHERAVRTAAGLLGLITSWPPCRCPAHEEYLKARRAAGDGDD
ncbi:hypothetical protein ACFQWA_00005 [Streptomyces thermogriseus]|uniref:Uncharacterized protein n=1 Tax=Streptomyces thermogriseus TaxID=75292 RepID=A0ABP4DMC0_9ACTN